MVLSIIVAGLPAYVMIKVLTPGFYARKDMKTPVLIAFGALVVGVTANFILVPIIGITALAATTAASAWLNALLLYALLVRRGHFRFEPWLVSRLLRQLAAAAAMAAALFFLQGQLSGFFDGSTLKGFVGVAILVSVGAGIYFGLAWLIGAMDKEDIRLLLRRRKAS
jgi:putative peptidoglycan lipid II flippase